MLRNRPFESGHKTLVCACGIVLSTCRCSSANKMKVVSARPCTHKGAQVPGLVESLAPNKSAFLQPTLVGFDED